MDIFGYTFGKKVEATNLTNRRAKRSSDIPQQESELTRVKQDVGKWRRAVIYAEAKHNHNRQEYYRLLKDVVLDNHLSSVMEQRKNGTLCREVCFHNSDGTENEEITKLFHSSWFVKLRSLMMDAKFYGFTLVDLGELVDFKFPTLTQVPRQFVKPEYGIVVNNPSDTTGIAIDDPKYAKWNVFFGENEDLGLLMKAAPWTLWKKTAVGYWSEYCEKFGMPMRIGKTNVNDDVLKENMERALRDMGSSFYAVLHTDDEIDLKETFNTQAFDIYDKLIERANSELSKLILSQTGTTDEKTYAGSAGVHQDVLGSLIERDVLWHDYNLNEVLKPVLIALGFPLGDGYFETGYEEKASIKDRIDMVAKFLPFMKFDKESLEEEFGITIESMIDKAAAVKKPITNDLRKYYDSL